ncbi:MAG: hypothetical protein ACR2QO_15875, partial [Acidimicrobiales bacterium]
MRTAERQLLQDLVDEGHDNVVSLYVPVDPLDPRNQHPVGEEWWRTKMTSLLNDLAGTIPADAATEFDLALEQLRDMAGHYQTDERGLVVFASATSVMTFPLEVPVDPHAAFGPPLLGPLVATLQSNSPFLVLAVAADRVRAVEFAFGESEELSNAASSTLWDMPGATRSAHRFRFEARREQYQRSYHQRIAERLDRLVSDGRVQCVVLSGAERECHGVLAAVAERTAELVAGIVAAPLDEGERELAERVLPVVHQYRNDAEAELVGSIVDRRAASGAGTVGVSSTKNALEMRLVRKLVLDPSRVDEAVVEDFLR